MALAPGMMQQRRGGLFGATSRVPQQQQAMPAMTATEQPMKKGFDWGKLIGVLGDSLSIAGGGQAQFVPNMIDQRNRRQAQAYAEQTYQRRRGDEMTDWQAKQEYERRNPSPVNNDTVNDYRFISQTLGEDAGKQYLKNLADGPPVAVDVANPDGSVTRQFIPRSQMQGWWGDGRPTEAGRRTQALWRSAGNPGWHLSLNPLPLGLSRRPVSTVVR